MSFRPTLPRLLHAAAILLLLLIAGGPLVACLLQLIGGGVETKQAGQSFVELGAWSYLGHGALAAAGAMALATFLGTALGLAGLPPKGRWLAVAALIPLIIPPTVYGLSWNSLWPVPKSEWIGYIRAILCLGLACTPLVFLLVLAARSLQDPAIDEAARLAGISPAKRLFRIDFPAVRGAAAAGGLAVFLFTFSSFEMCAALNFSSFPEAIYQRYMETNTLGAPAALAIAGASPALILALLCWSQLHRREGRSLEFQPRLPLAAPGAKLPWILWLGYLAVAIAVPCAGLFYRVGGKLPVQSMWRDLLQGVQQTLPVIFTALVATIILGWVLADTVLAHKKTGLLILGLVFLSLGIAPSVIGIGLIKLWIPLEAPIRAWLHRPRLNLIYGTDRIFELALMGRFLALPILLFAAARRLLPSDFTDSARLTGLSYARQQFHLLMPVLAVSWVAVATPCLALMLGELGATTMLSAPGTELLSYRLHSRIHIGPESYVAAFSIMYAVLVLALTGLFWLTGIWVLQGRRNRSDGLS